MHPFLAPPSWPDPQPKPGGGRFAATIVRNTPELLEGEDGGGGAQAELAKCRVALIGIPDDTGVVLNGGRAGARRGPAAFRAALGKYGVASPADESADLHAYPRAFDAGDVIIGADIHETHNRVTEVVLAVLERGLFPIAIGGGHDLTFPFVRGVAKAFGPLDGMYLDAHLDVRPQVGSGMPFRSLIEGGFVKELCVHGLNPLVNTREHMEYFESKGGSATRRDEGIVRQPVWLDGRGDADRRAFVSLDLDVFDSAHAPGVSALNPCGLTPAQVEPVIHAAGVCAAVRCFDIMELNPDHDADGRTARLAAHLFLVFCADWRCVRRGRSGWNSRMSLAIINARFVTLTEVSRIGDAGLRPAIKMGGEWGKDGAAGALGMLPKASVLIEQGQIAAVLAGDEGAEAVRRAEPKAVIDAGGRVLMPGFVDCHTHACWAGDRTDEWLHRRRGLSYLDVLNAGGGIMSTVRAVRAASQAELSERLLERLLLMLAEGSTTIEVKSGYGLSTEDELKMLRAIRDAAAMFPGTIVPTALLGHAVDPAFAGGAGAFVEHTISHTLPAVSREFPGIAVDAFCEKGAWSAEQCVRLFEAAISLGHPVRVHADQFNALGMVKEAVKLGAMSVDHLEASTPDDLAALAKSDHTFGVALPICGLHVDDRYANARQLLDSSPTAKLAIATNFNPGSAPCGSMPLAIALAVRRCGLWPAEAIAAATVNPACLLGLHDRGVIARGQRADLILLRHTDERQLAYEVGMPHVDTVICAGRVVKP